MPRRPGKAAASHLQLVDTLSEWRSHHVLARDGLRLHLREIGNRAGGDLPVICLPGLSRNADDFEVIGRALAETGDRWVIALDSRGRGGSEYDPDWRRYDLQVELDDLFNVIDALGIGRAIFFGTSRGGLLTALTAITRPAVIAASILNDIGPIIEGRGLARIRGYVGKLPRPKSFDEATQVLRQVFGTHFTDMAPEAWARFARRTWKEGPKGLEPRYDPNLMRPLAELDLEKPLPVLWTQFETLAVAPMMVIRGELSDILGEQTAREMVARHPDARLHEVPYQGHAPILEDAPTIEAVRAFVASLG
ncbi:alpha/beta hydrolase [Rhabdaerophilum sp. SD176]|uniref:alpha/beta fold hydrolase n=1 Tax=Rhabdaerophilum sp. SD176 TaxID=2983548 RepID=UPI0024DFE6AC|nr:alpha/beta hydrolase [Rhabdaerophilum sp. SD176]